MAPRLKEGVCFYHLSGEETPSPPLWSRAVDLQLLFPKGLSRSIKCFHLFLKHLGKGLFL